MIGARGKPHVFEQLPRALPAFGLRHAGFRLWQLDVLGGGQHRQQEKSLEHEADLPQPQQASLAVRQLRTSSPSKSSVPDVGVSTQPSMCSSVDLPQPDGPRIGRGDPPAQSAASHRATAVTGPAAIGKMRLMFCGVATIGVIPITSSRSVAAIGRLGDDASDRAPR